MANVEKKLPWELAEPSSERPLIAGPRAPVKKSRRMFSNGSGGVYVINDKKYPPDSIITSDMPTASN